jgi:hypothetical protein
MTRRGLPHMGQTGPPPTEAWRGSAAGGELVPVTV